MSTILDPTSEIYKRTAIHCLYEMGMEPNVVAGELSIRFPGITTAEVSSWFNRFREGNLEIGEIVSINEKGIVIDKSIDLDLNEPESDLTTQISRTPHVNVYQQYTAQLANANQRAINLASLNLSSNLDVQSTSRPPKFPPLSMRAEKMLALDIQPSIEIRLRLAAHCIVLATTYSTGLKEVIRYFKRPGNQCGIKNEKMTAFTLNPYIVEAMEAFKRYIRADETKINLLAINSHEKEHDRSPFLKGVVEVFNGLKEKIIVETLEIDFDRRMELYTILESVHVGPLKNFIVNGNSSNQGMLEMGDIPSLAQHLPFLQVVRWSNMETNIELEEFAHLKVFHASVHKITKEQIAAYRNKICESDVFSESIISGKCEQDICEALKPYELPERFDDSMGRFIISDQQQIRFSYDLSDGIKLKKFPLCIF
ncbi:hypothetical protein B9Z55_023488 [Caenorhabditis nigoni]|uniref:DUF38 domain-containing protein n=1 Tax=Caenorhabditis nigoni TaxID=1611254 RepID=A0A2G5SQ75_9PELO|nr:hypothetical protein B9Z55_023488 [Caenorhabditis nigoni]